MHRPRLTAGRLAPLLGLVLLHGVSAVSAQTVYRSVAPDGRVTFSDRPPALSAATQGAATNGARGAAGSGSALPYALQQVVNRFPVTLYATTDCAPCDSARQLLQARGVPFSERTVRSNEDIDALKRLSGENTLPFGSIGAQQLKGFSDLEWTQFLDAAGYPATSQLPSQYQPPPATPLVAVRAPETAPARSAAAPVQAAPAPTQANPAGISF